MIEPILESTSNLFFRKDFPNISMWPSSASINDSMHLREVLFPAPLGPKKPKTSFLYTEKDTSFKALNPLNDFFKFFTETINSDIFLKQPINQKVRGNEPINSVGVSPKK